MKTFTVTAQNDGMALVDALSAAASVSRRKAKELLDSRGVFVNEKRVWMARHRLGKGDNVQFPPAAVGGRESKITADVLYEDDAYLVVNKPAGIVSNGEDSLESVLRQRRAEPGLRAVHRLDRDTSGCLIFARHKEGFDAMVGVFRRHEIDKRYHVIVNGEVRDTAETVTRPLGGQRATTAVKQLDSNREASHLMVRITTGRIHQIRRHMAMIHHPVLGDRAHATRRRVGKKAMQVGRQMLHASEIAFEQPLSGEKVRAKAPLPSDFRRCLKLFGLT